MFRLTLLLSVSMVLVALIAGRDNGQLRPGLARALQEEAAAPRLAAATAAGPASEPAAAPPAPSPAPSPAAPTPPPIAVLAQGLDLPLVEPAAAAPVTATAPAPATPGPEGTVFRVSAEAVNVREGPSTREAVLDRLLRDEAVLVLWTDDTGWARIRIEGDGVEGYVYADYLVPAD